MRIIHRNISRLSNYFKNSCRVCTWRCRNWGWSMNRFIMLRPSTTGGIVSCWIMYLLDIKIESGIYNKRTRLFYISKIKRGDRSWLKLSKKYRCRLSSRRSRGKKDRFWPFKISYTAGELTKNKWRRSSLRSNKNRLK